jgi:AcrR family transcriptional regulator
MQEETAPTEQPEVAADERGSSSSSGDRHREQLVGGLLAALATKSYASTTIADIVRHASVSKRTFYEHFADKDACFVAAYELASRRTIEAIAESVDANAAWETQVRTAVNAYVAMLEASPALARTFMLEVHAAGPAAVELQRAVHARYAKLLQRLVTRGRKTNAELGPLGTRMATAVVGAINELTLDALGSGERTLRKVTPTIVRLVRAVLTTG